MTVPNSPTAERQQVLLRRARWLARVTVAYNVVEATLSVAAGAVAGSIALVSFGGDALIESLSALVILWQLRGVHRDREARALRLIALSFFALAAAITFESLRSLLSEPNVSTSPVGIALAATSLILMPVLSWAKRRTGTELASRTVVADSRQTLLCAYLSGVLLMGLLANTWWSWGWADSVAALVIAAVALQEGRETWRGETD